MVRVAAARRGGPIRGAASEPKRARLIEARLPQCLEEGGGDSRALGSSRGPGLHGVCGDCGALKSSSVPFHEGVDACQRCFRKYAQGFSFCGTFSQYCEKKNSDDTIAEDSDMAHKIIDKRIAADWKPCDVTSADTIKVTISKTMAGPSRAQIVEASGRTPEEMGMRLQYLKYYNGDVYKGLLVPSPGKP